MTENIKNSGIILRHHRNAWDFHYSTEHSFMGRMNDNVIELPNCKSFYWTRDEATKAAEATGYIVEPINSSESRLLFDVTTFGS